MSNTVLKLIAMIVMLLDHIGMFIPGAPPELRWIGRIAAPIFIFCCINGFMHTSNRKRYFIRIYSLGVLVELMNVLFAVDYTLRANILPTILTILICLWLIEKVKRKDEDAWKWVGKVFLWQGLTFIILFGSYVGLGYDLNSIPNGEHLFLTVTGSFFDISYGWLFVALGILMYLTYDNKKYFIISYLAITGLYVIFYNTALIPSLSIWMEVRIPPMITQTFLTLIDITIGVDRFSTSSDMVYGNPQWMMLFAIPFIRLYNGKKGCGIKWLFYIFYPVHIFILYTIGQLLISLNS